MVTERGVKLKAYFRGEFWEKGADKKEDIGHREVVAVSHLSHQKVSVHHM